MISKIEMFVTGNATLEAAEDEARSAAEKVAGPKATVEPFVPEFWRHGDYPHVMELGSDKPDGLKVFRIQYRIRPRL